MIVVRLLRGLLAALLVALAPMAARAADSVTVFAAASLTDALQKLGAAYEAAGGHVVFNFAATSTLAHQIESSGGADVFLSADIEWMDYLDGKGLIDRATRRNIVGNRLVLIAPAGSGVNIAIAPHLDLVGALGGGRLAIADPDSVPAGQYGRAALTTLGVWEATAPHLVQAENVRVALAYVARGEAPLGIVYATDAKAEPRVRVVGAFPESTHAPIVYPAALTRDAKPGAGAFLRFLSAAPAAAIFKAAGFTVLQ